LVPNNSASLAPFRVSAPEGSILNALRPSPVAARHVIGHMVPDLVLGALHHFLPGRIPAESAGALWNIQISAQSRSNDTTTESRRQVLMFNSGGTGARVDLDGMSATAFPSGVYAMSVEATEQVGPIVVWRKELLCNSGGAGKRRGGLGQRIEIGAAAGYDLQFNAMFDRVKNPARGRLDGLNGGAGVVRLSDGTVLKGKGRQPVTPGTRLVLDLPGGGGFGHPSERERHLVAQDLEAEYIDADHARTHYNFESGN
jgi:N-methylhydantoinase B